MNADLDLNDFDLINAGTVNADNLVVAGTNLNSVVAQAATSATNAAASASSAAASAATASQYTSAYFTDVAALLADTRSWPTGQILNTREEGFAYEVVTSGQHVTTAGGVKLIVLPTGTGNNVKAFGAVGDGITDDTTAIQNALNVGSVVNFVGDNKVYLSKSLTVSNPDTTLNLQGNTLKVHPAISGTRDLISIQANNVSIKNGTLDGNSEINGRHLIDVEGDYACLENLTLVDATSDAIWIPQFGTYGYGDHLIVRDVTINNPGRHGVLYSWDNVNYRDSAVFENVTLTKSSNTNWGMAITAVNNATITGIKALDGFAEKLNLGRMSRVEVQGYFVADDSLTSDLVDSVFVDNVFIRDSYFKGRLAGTAYNPSNTSTQVTVSNCRFEDVRNGVGAFENVEDITVTGCQFYRCDTALSLLNSSSAILTNNYFEDCKRTLSAGTTTVDGSVNYDNLVLVYNGNIVKRTGVEAIQIANTVGSFNVVEITNNLFYNIHNVVSAFPAWGSYTPTSDVSALLISSANAAIPVLNVSNNSFIQDTPYASGVAGGGANSIMSLSNSVELLRMRDNFLSKNYDYPLLLNADITGLDVDTYIDSTEIDLSAGSVSFTGAPAMTKGTYLGLRLIYQEATSADAGIAVVLRDSVTGTVKGTITTTQSAAAGNSSFVPTKSLQIVKGRGPQIYTAGGKTGSGTCFARAYYLMLQQ
jgi:hypothetical protein